MHGIVRCLHDRNVVVVIYRLNGKETAWRHIIRQALHEAHSTIQFYICTKRVYTTYSVIYLNSSSIERQV